MAFSNHFWHEIATVVFTLCVCFGILFPSCRGCSGDECRIIMFREPIENKAMTGHVIGRAEVPNQGTCRVMCYMEPNCVSINFGPSAAEGKYICELNSAGDDNKLSFINRESFTFLAIENPCSTNPCLNGAACHVGFTRKGYRCICHGPFAGENCNVLIKSCSHLKKLIPESKCGIYTIDPDGEGGLPPIYDVTCDMTDKNGVGVTVISHDSEARTHVTGFENPGSYSRDIQYKGANFSQLASLANVSQQCEQFIKYECRSSLMFYNDHAWWVSRDSVKMSYWGGAESGSGKCACGMNNTCADGSTSGIRHVCNCDKNDNVWREDSGLLTYKTHLPVGQLRFGDTGYDEANEIDEQGYHTLGKFKCYGVYGIA